MKIFLCPSPELYHLYHRDKATVIITDIFRASSTIVTAIANGAIEILPVATTQEAQSLGKALNCLVAAERNVRRCDFADLGNDPLEYTHSRIQGKSIALTTTNGTRSLHIAREAGAKDILIGSMLNISATLDYCLAHDSEEIVVLAAGWQGQLSTEDCLYAGALAHTLEEMSKGEACGDAAVFMTDLWREHCLTLENRIAYIKRSEHYHRLESAGFEQAVDYCMQIDSHPVVVKLEQKGEYWSLVRVEA